MLAAICKDYDSKFIHISIDYVFDGNATSAYTENFQTHPINHYGASKLEGEKQAFEFNPDSIVIRSSWVYSEFGKNFVKTMLELMTRKNEISVVNDQLGSPTYAADLAETILKIISSGKWQPGIYHYCNEGVINWYEFAQAICEISGNHSKINPISTSEYPTPAIRPGYTAMDTKKIQTTFEMSSKKWKESLITCVHKLR